jgi:hypothetical protein
VTGNAPSTAPLVRHVSEPLAAQVIEGTIRLRIWGQSLDPAHPATWALTLRVLSKDGKEERGALLPLTTGSNQKFATQMAPVLIGPLSLIPLRVLKGDRLIAEIGAFGRARIEPRDDKQAWMSFSTDLCFENFSAHLNDKQTSREINRCIYCNAVGPDLSREHIIPAGLNGDLTLAAASCRTCSDITSAVELDVLRTAVGPLRDALKLRSRRPEKRKTHLPMYVRRGETRVQIQVPIDEHPTMLALPTLAPPGCIAGRPDSESIEIVQMRVTQLTGLPFNELHKKYGVDADEIGTTIAHHPHNFARLLAKIAYGFAVLRLGLANISERYLPAAILGQDKRVARWVGCDLNQPSQRGAGLHQINLRIDNGEIHAFVRLFAEFGAPEYHVVVGKVPGQ